MSLPGSDSLRILVYLNGALITLILGLVLYIVVQRILRATWDDYARKRRARYEPLVLAWITARPEDGPLQGVETAPKDRFFEDLLLEQAALLWGESRDMLTEIFERLGFVERNVKALGSYRWWRRAEAAAKLGKMGSRQAVPALLRAAADPIEDVRMAAAHSLITMKEEQGLQMLLHSISSASRWTTIRLAELVQEMGAAILPDILSLLASSQSKEVRVLCLDMMGLLRSPSTSIVLIQSLRDGDSDVRAAAARALGQIGTPESVSFLVNALKDESWFVRAQATRALGRIAAPESLRPILGLLADSAWRVRYEAAAAIACFGHDGEIALAAASACGALGSSGVASLVQAEQALKAA